ncbi:hypothetical protein MBT84_45260 [Streptomyces sp. MBT84]|uniref:hypothetical protein n=1 Tax=Streptomyces sp. MBT84 TaxID=1488414 RepID=UPI001C6F59D2|nr:hypothetical protein [Streptomyces sp. MBT84]MBW8706862.1 hypothetical protein [Streptomyces sp. MBT84]
MARDHNQASQPALKNGRIAYIEDGLFDGTYGVRIQMYNIANGTTTALGAPSQPEWISTPVMTSSDVYWLIDTDYTDQDQTTLRRAHLGSPDGAVVTDVIPEKSNRATPAYGLTATDSAVTLTVYPSWGQVFDDPNDSLAKLYQYARTVPRSVVSPAASASSPTRWPAPAVVCCGWTPRRPTPTW